MAADHADAPASAADPAADINDLFVFKSTDADNNGSRTVLAMTVFPEATNGSRLSDAVEYNFHIADRSTTPATMMTISCTADNEVNQTVTCVIDEGSASTTLLNPVIDATYETLDQTLRTGDFPMLVYAGVRDDPFFFDSVAFGEVYQSVLDGSPSPGALLDDTGVDAFAADNVIAIVVDVADTALPSTSNNLAVWAETVRIGQ